MLSQKATQLIHDYLNLPFPGVGNVRCPYFNNARPQQRSQLRVLAGKGMPKEIVEEAKIISIQYNHEIFDTEGNCKICKENKAEEIRRYLIDNGLGVDCSGFVIHILQQHFLEKNDINLTQELRIISPKKIFRWLVSKLRPVENINVKTLTNNENSNKITQINNIEPADLIIMLKTGPNHKRDHILLVTDVKHGIITYVNARAWSCEGKYGHGVAEGLINIIKPDGGLLEQEWEELGKKEGENETYLEGKNAEVMEIRRLKFT